MLLQELNRSRVWDTLQDMERLQLQLNNLFANGRQQLRPEYPALNIWIASEGAIVTAEIPGADPDSLDISVANETLTLRGQRLEAKNQEGNYHRRERALGQFSKTVELPFKVQAETVQAKFKNGILTIELPRAEEEKPKKISVNSI
jgi:HSP20 family protein